MYIIHTSPSTNTVHIRKTDRKARDPPVPQRTKCSPLLILHNFDSISSARSRKKKNFQKDGLIIFILHPPRITRLRLPPPPLMTRRRIVRGATVGQAIIGGTHAILLLLPDAGAEEQGGEEEGRPAGPGPGECVCADVCVATVSAEDVAGFDEGDASVLVNKWPDRKNV